MGAKFAISLWLCVCLACAAYADQHEQAKGAVTGLPLPRFVSMKAEKGFARRGPSSAHRIDWVFLHKDLPLKIINEYEHWRRVEDSEGQGGWMYFRLLSGQRYIVFTSQSANLYRRANTNSPIIAQAQKGVIAELGDCDANWCKISVDRTKGWVEKSHIWGVSDDEIRN